jgi:hypothetical protein
VSSSGEAHKASDPDRAGGPTVVMNNVREFERVSGLLV